MNLWMVFRNKETGEELLAYTIKGTFPGERKETIELLAYENHIPKEQITTTIEDRRSRKNSKSSETERRTTP